MKKVILIVSTLALFANATMIITVKNKLYLKECGSCHFAFQPGLLPQRSWSKLMENLSNHFKTDASLSEVDKATLLNYLTKNSSEHSRSYLGRVMKKYIRKDTTPLRITETPPFIKRHRNIRNKTFKRKSIMSPSNCIACHRLASRGVYEEDYVSIPRR